MAMSRPVLSCPSVSTTMRLRRLFRTRVWWVSASPSSQGNPACLIEVWGDAPVPPSKPEISTTSAWALATPAAIVPTPTSDTSLTLIRASRLAFLRSWISSARSSLAKPLERESSRYHGAVGVKSALRLG
jgi:hypothetical protein